MVTKHPRNHVGIGDLPVPIGVADWTPLRRGAIIVAIQTGELTVDLADRIYGIDADTLDQWRADILATTS